MFSMMIYSVLGKNGMLLLDFYIENQLIINIVVLGYGILLFIKKRINPNIKTDYERLKEKIHEKTRNYNTK